MKPLDMPEEEEGSEFGTAGVPEWARKTFEKLANQAPPAPPSAKDFAGKPAWPALVDAALVGSFRPADLSVGVRSSEDESHDAQSILLGFAERINGVDGPRWSLTSEARRSVLGAASKGDIVDAIERTKSQFSDPVSMALREHVSGDLSSTVSPTLPQLEASRLAALWLGDVQHESAPSFEAVDQKIASYRLLRPFYHMVGIDDAKGTRINSGELRLFGRESEISRLYDYVGVVPTGSTGSFVNQVWTSLKRIVGSEPPMVIHGGGGVGKTTLIAKFVLEHAQSAQARYPFVYLDFNRALLSARRPVHLLMEMCRQVMAQFPELAPQLAPLHDEAGALAATLELSPDSANEELVTFRRLGGLLDQFRGIIDAQMTAMERSFEFKRPFLLILDTFEVVQYSESSVTLIERFVEKLSPSRDADGRGWSRLRLIISGRKRPDQFLGGFVEIELGSLGRDGAIDMLQTLAKDAGRPVGREPAARLLEEVERIGQQNRAILSPLRIRLIGEIFHDEKDKLPNGDAIADHLLDELQGASSSNVLSGKLIEGVLVKRILDHVADTRVKALADPGLVVRRITPDVIRQVMARGTPAPGPDKESDKDLDKMPFAAWDVSDEQAKDIFQAFSREGRLVEPDGDALRHRQDVREDMLPLIRARRPNRFIHLHELASTFYQGEVQRDPGDPAARAEAIYHGLWSGVELGAIGRLWPPSSDFDPRIAADEFDDRPKMRRFVLAKTGMPLAADDLAQLPRDVTAAWAAARRDLWLQDDQPNAMVALARAAVGQSFEGLESDSATATVVGRLLYRSGQWSDCEKLIHRHLLKQGDIGDLEPIFTGAAAEPMDFRLQDGWSMLRTWTTMSARLGADERPLLLAMKAGLSSAKLEPLTRIELLSNAVLGHRMFSGRLSGADNMKAATSARICELALEIPASTWRQRDRTLRLALLAADGRLGPLLAQYQLCERTWDLDTASLELAGRALSLAYAATGDADTAGHVADLAGQVASSPDIAPSLRSLWSAGRSRIVDAVQDERNVELQSLVRQVAVFDHQDWGAPFGHALTRFLEGPSGEALRDALRRENFVADAISRSAAVDGPSIVQGASSRGNLLRLVETIEQFSDEQAGATASAGDSDYPDTVFGLAEGLLLWHDVNLAALGGEEPRSDAGDAAPSRSTLGAVVAALRRKRTAKKASRSTVRTRRKK